MTPTITGKNRGMKIAGIVIALFLVVAFFSPTNKLAMIVVGLGIALYFYTRYSVPTTPEIREYVLGFATRTFPGFNVTNEMQGCLGNSGVMLDESNKKLLLYENRGALIGVYEFRDLMRSEVVEDGNMINSTVRTSQIASAIVGGLVLGGVGAVVGGLTGKTRSNSAVSKITLMITVNDRSNPLYQIDLLDVKKPLLKSSEMVKSTLRMANHGHSLFSVLIKQADDHDKLIAQQTPAPQPQPLNPPPSNFDRNSFADEFTKLSELKNKGVLTDAEFQSMKAALINRARST